MNGKMKWGLALATALILLCFVGIANAQIVSKSVKVTWILPTTYADGTALPTGTLTKIQVYIGVGPIADNATVGPTVEVAPGAQPVLRTISVPAGGKVYARLRSCIVDNCSALSPEVTLDIPKLVPGFPTSVTLELVIT